jgi:subtilisin family serine protease
LVKFKEDVIGDLLQSKALIQNVIDATRGKIKTYLGQEVATANWEPFDLTSTSFIGDPWLFHIKLPDEIGVDDAISFFKSIPYVKYAEKNYVRYLQTTFPNDPDIWVWDETRQVKRQWALYNPEHNRCDIHAPEAWDIFTGSSDIVVAVIDTGIDLSHEDLAANIWANPNDPSGGGDNDHNGFEDDVNGWNFVFPGGNVPQDTDGHGTRMSGIIGAVGNNGVHMSGVCWNVKIMPLRIRTVRDTSSGIAEIVNAIDYAVLNGASVINASFGDYHFSQAEEDAIERARGKNVLFIAAAGNWYNGYDTDDSPIYPADYPLDNIISVLSTDPTDHKGYQSCYGYNSVDLGAPGEPIWSTTLGNTYGFNSGTSEAAAHVTGVAALALGMCPGLTSNRLRSLIINIDNVDDVFYLYGLCASGGRLNAYKVLNALEGSASPSAPSTLSACPTGWDTILVDWHDNSNNELGFEVQRKDQFQTYFIRRNCVDSNPTSFVSYKDRPVGLTQGKTYTYRVRAVNRAGISAFSNTAEATIPNTAPAAPSDLAAPEAVYPDVHLEWVDIANNEFTFSLERRPHGTGHWSVRATLGQNQTTYVDSNVQIGHIYDYRVRAQNPVGYSGYSNTITVEVENW